MLVIRRSEATVAVWMSGLQATEKIELGECCAAARALHRTVYGYGRTTYGVVRRTAVQYTAVKSAVPAPYGTAKSPYTAVIRHL